MDSEHQKEVERLLRELSREEKAQLLQWVARDLFNAWAYVRSHREEIEREITEHEAA